MSRRDLLRLADLALEGHVSPQLPHEVLRVVVGASGARAGRLVSRDGLVASWPEDDAVELTGDSIREVPLTTDGESWVARLADASEIDDSLLMTAKLALRAWDLKEELKRSRFDERFRLWELEAIRSIATSVGGILDSDRLAEELMAHLVALLGVRSAQLFLGADPGSAACVAAFGEPALAPEELERAWRESWREDWRVCLPLQARDGTLGVLVAAHKEARSGTEPFSVHDLRLMELFAVQATIALENARLTQVSLERERLRRELEVAATIQSHLYPRALPDLPGFKLAVRSRASRHVCGDLFDVLGRDGHLLAVVADVTGKGVGAGLLASGIHAGVRLVAADAPLDEVAVRLNRYLCGATASNRFATMVVVRFEPGGAWTAVNAGHCPALLRRAGGEVELVPSSGLPLGVLADATYVPASGELGPGDAMVLYTDGLTEAAPPGSEDELGVERLAQALADLGEPGADALCDGLMATVDAHAGGGVLADDATLLVVTRSRG